MDKIRCLDFIEEQLKICWGWCNFQPQRMQDIRAGCFGGVFVPEWVADLLKTEMSAGQHWEVVSHHRMSVEMHITVLFSAYVKKKRHCTSKRF